MSVIEKFSAYIHERNLFARKDKVLLAVSGGKDSMLLMYMMHRLGYSLVIAHCNFQLRGIESDLDEKLVCRYADGLNIPCFVQRFDTTYYAEEHKISVQMSARELRYEWFEELRQQEECDFIAIAQHQQDHIETVLINLARGTGLQGLSGIAERRDVILRPMLSLTPEDIRLAVQEYAVPYRDDQSNFSTKYIRNKVRLDILPRFREVNPDFDRIMVDNIARFSESYALLQQFVQTVRDDLFEKRGDQILISKDKLARHKDNIPLLYELFRPFQFEKNVLEGMVAAFDKNPGLIFRSDTSEFLLDRECLILREIGDSSQVAEVIISEETKMVVFNSKGLSIELQEGVVLEKEKDLAQIDAAKIVYPLMLRYWKTGDRFEPLGLKGSQKLSDFFIQQKIPVFDKSSIPILVNGNHEIMWVVGHRMDERYKITENTKKVIKFVYG